MSQLLYRGVNAALHEKLNGALQPKAAKVFMAEPKWGQATWGNNQWGSTIKNAVIEHQIGQNGLPTSGISTTPHLERARFYATHGETIKHGYIYVIDSELLEKNNVIAYRVNSLVQNPSVPEDDEVILVANNFGSLPEAIIKEVIKFTVPFRAAE